MVYAQKENLSVSILLCTYLIHYRTLDDQLVGSRSSHLTITAGPCSPMFTATIVLMY